MLEPPIDVSSGKATSSNCDSKYDETGFEAHLDLKSSKFSPDINPIIVIPIQVFSLSAEPFNQTCSAYEPGPSLSNTSSLSETSQTNMGVIKNILLDKM